MKKNKLTRTLSGAAVAGSLLVLTACSDRSQNAVERSAENAADKMASAYDATKDTVAKAAERTADAFEEGWDKVKNATYADRGSFRTGVEKMAASLDANIDKLGDKTGDAASAGVERLRAARADLGRSIDRLGDATEATWDDAKRGVAEAWDRVKAAYRDVAS